MSALDANTEQILPAAPTTHLRFHQIRSPHFRVIHADGVWGGPTPHGFINATFYSERLPIPQEIVIEVAADGRAEELVAERVGREGVLRELEVSIMCAPRVAREFAQWLIKQAEQVESAAVASTTGGDND